MPDSKDSSEYWIGYNYKISELSAQYIVIFLFLCVCVCVSVSVHVCMSMHSCGQSCLSLCNPVNCSPRGSFIYGISQARILEWVAISYSRGSSQHRDWTCVSWVSCIGWKILYHWTTWEATLFYLYPYINREIYNTFHKFKNIFIHIYCHWTVDIFVVDWISALWHNCIGIILLIPII